MITENLSTLKIHKLTQAQYDREVEAGTVDDVALYLIPDNGDADTLDGKHADEFASADSVRALQNLVGNQSISTQIDNALANFSSGKTLTEHLTEEDMILSSRQYGDKLPGEDGEPYTHVAGRIFFKRKVE